jgi:Domain of unknown function (DUF4169)
MAEIVNLRTVKKRLASEAAKAAARENRVRHGRDKTAKANDQREQERRAAQLDALRRGEAGE